MGAGLRELVSQYLSTPDTSGSGVGMSAAGCLSPLLGAVYLMPLDAAMQRLMGKGHISYVRYMDDFVVLAKTRWHLRKATKVLKEVTSSLKLRLHQKEKLFIGRAERGFDFLGYRIHPTRKLRPSAESVRRFRERYRRLQERGASQQRLWQYVLAWQRWLRAGLGEFEVKTNGSCCDLGGGMIFS